MLDEKIQGIKDSEVFNAYIVAASKLNDINNERIMVSVSGGADSDILVDMFSRLDVNKKVQYVWFNTGLEYQATKDHIKYLEEKYNIEIRRESATKPIPKCCKQYGQPFLSKQVSEYISRLQAYGFEWEDESLEVLLPRYCEWDSKKQSYVGCASALRWWCNAWGEKSKFNIERNRYLKEFMIANPPQFLISNVCCKYSKKEVGNTYKRTHNIQLSCTGLRKAEGGARSSAYKNCYTKYEEKADEYRPIWKFKNDSKLYYDQYFNLKHSRCYSEYELERTGCAGCPCGKNFEKELEIIQKHEPNLYKAATTIFKDSYAYLRDYRAFIEGEKNGVKKEQSYSQLPLDEYLSSLKLKSSFCVRGNKKHNKYTQLALDI